MIKWLKPKNDFVFKLIFGSDDETSKELLIAFLNDVLAVPEGQSLAGVEILNPTINKQYLSDKLAVLDIKAKITGYGIINVEIQLTNQKNMHKRSLYYSAKMIEGQLEESESYYKLSRVVAVNLIDYHFFTSDNYCSRFRLMEETTNEPFPDLLQLHFFEMPKFVRQDTGGQIDSDDRMAKWLRFIKNEDDTRWEKMAKQEPIIGKAVEKLKLASLDPQARMDYEAREKALKDMASIREDGLQEGMEKGMERGIEKGQVIKGQKIAKNLLSEGVSHDIITKATGLSKSEIEKLQQEMDN